MTTPPIDTRTREDLLDEIKRRASFYTPEWRYSSDSPDAGAALAFIWAEMLSDVWECYSRVLENYRLTLLDSLGSDPKPPLPAQGYLSFKPLDGNEPVIVPPGSAVGSPEHPDVLVTERSLVASPAQITDIFYTHPGRDACKRYETLENIPLFEHLSNGLHSWTFSHPYAFDVSPGARLKLEIYCGGTAFLTGAGVSLQFECGGLWRDFCSAEAGADSLLLLFPDETREKCTAIRFVFSGDAAQDRVLSGVRAFPSGVSLTAEALYANDAEESDTGCYPFGQRFIPYNCFYLSCREAFSKPGAAIELSFVMQMEEWEIEGYPQPEIIRKPIMRPAELRHPERYVISIREVAWEYFNGTGWASLPLETLQYRAVFSAELPTPTRYTIRFTCPADIKPIICGAHDALFIRARVVRVDNLFRTNGHYRTPWIISPRFRYHYPGMEGVTINTALVAENRDTLEVSLETPVRLASRVLEKPSLCLAFDRPFTTGSVLFQMESVMETPPLAWEYYTEKGWSSLDIHDGTENLGKTGIITYMTTTPPVKRRLMGHDAWWMRITDAEDTYDHPTRRRPVIVRLYENTVPARARIPGESANQPANSYRTLSQPIRGIISAHNPLSALGGCEEEDENRIIRRLTGILNHGGRAVSRADMEYLAVEASPRVVRSRCFPFTNPRGKSSPGDTCLVILRKGGADEKEDFTPLRKQVADYIAIRRPLAFDSHERLHIIEPRYTAVSLTIVGGITALEGALTAKNAILEMLARYLDALHGGADGNGWEIGVLPSPSDLALALRRMEVLSYIQSIHTVYRQENGSLIKNYTDVSADRFALPQNGIHTIHLY